MERTRTVTWHDPNETAQFVGKMSGLALLQMIIEKQMAPPIARVLDFALVEAREGFAAFEFQPQEFHYNPTGQVHGGMAAMIMDSALGCAVLSTLPAGVGYTTSELSINLVREITLKTPRLRAEANILHRGRTIRTAECKLTGADGKLYAHGTTTCVVLGA